MTSKVRTTVDDVGSTVGNTLRFTAQTAQRPLAWLSVQTQDWTNGPQQGAVSVERENKRFPIVAKKYHGALKQSGSSLALQDAAEHIDQKDTVKLMSAASGPLQPEMLYLLPECNEDVDIREAFQSYIDGSTSMESKRSFLLHTWARSPLVNHVYDQDPQRGVLVLSPDSKIVTIWDFVITVGIMWTLIVMPVEVAGLIDPSQLSWFSLFLDLTFILDIGVNFSMAFEQRGAVTFSMVWDRWAIAQNYASGWLAADVLCALPVDLLQYSAVQFRLLRILRLVRVVKLARLQVLSRVDLPFTVIAMIKCLILSVSTAHVLACVWSALVTMQPDHRTWVDHLIETKLGLREMRAQEEPLRLYLWSLYYATTIVTTVGFGDVVAQTNIECIVSTANIVIGSVLWAYILSSLLDVLNRINPHRNHFESTMDELNAMMRDHMMPESLRQDVRNFFFECEDLWKFQRRGHLIQRMSPSLKGRVTLAFCGEWIVKVKYIRTLFEQGVPDSTGFVVELARKLVPKIFVSGEVLLQPALYIIRKGLVARGPRVLGAGDVCGEDLLLQNPRNRIPYLLVALTTTGTLALSQSGLLDTLSRFRHQQRHVRRHTLWLGCKRGLARELRAMARASGLPGRTESSLSSEGRSTDQEMDGTKKTMSAGARVASQRSREITAAPERDLAEDEDLAPPLATVADITAAMQGLELAMKRHQREVMEIIHRHVRHVRPDEDASARPSPLAQQMSPQSEHARETASNDLRSAG